MCKIYKNKLKKQNMFKNFWQNIRYFLLLILLLIISFLAINFYIVNFSENKIYSVNDLSKTKIWIVLWASVKSNWEPSVILADRLKTSVEAYKLWKISKIIVSGDNRKLNYNEPDNMKNYLVKLWVKKEDIYPDYAWFDTYDSMYRAKEIFSVKKIVIFTQKYHLYRAIYIWEKLWIQSVWVSADKQKYLWIITFKTREIFARIKAFLEIEIFKTNPKFLGDKIEIK